MQNNKVIAKKPFGLSLSVKIAIEAIKKEVAPTSVVLSNLFHLQKSDNFPKELDIQFFVSQKQQNTEPEKRVISQILTEMKRPQIDLVQILESHLSKDWVRKISRPEPISQPVKFIKKNKPTNKKIVSSKNEPKTIPVVTVKKNKLS